MSQITLVTGGARSGKSRYALELTQPWANKVFVATAQPIDEEMHQRIARHQVERGPDFTTIEEPCDLPGALRRIPAQTDIAVVDCVTVWLGNLMHHHGYESTEYPELAGFLRLLTERLPCRLVVVSNELGLGVVPEHAMARRFRDLAGQVNQELARLADRVVMVVSGIPLVIKGENS